MRKLTAGSAVALAVLMLTAAVAVALPKGWFFIQRAKLTKQADGSWSGPGTLDGIKGTLTIRGTVHWAWVAGKRRVAGCAVEEVLTRPHGVQLWDGYGRITTTSAQERKYRGRHVGVYGPTKRDDLTHAQISVAQAQPHPGLRAVNCH